LKIRQNAALITLLPASEQVPTNIIGRRCCFICIDFIYTVYKGSIFGLFIKEKI